MQTKNKNKYIALKRIIANKHEKIIKLLFSKSANVNKLTRNTRNVLCRAIIKRNKAIMQFFLDY